MGKGVTVKVVFNKTDQVIGQANQKIGAAVRQAAFDIQAEARQNAPVDTGFLRNSIEVLKLGVMLWMIEVGAEYGYFVEFGTSKMQAQPFLIPAMESVLQKLDEAIDRAISDAIGS